MSAQPKKILTAGEYLALERKASFKSEYYRGEMFAMAGASDPHNLIVSNIIRMLGNQVLERDCFVYPGDMRVKVNALGKYTYPDVMVVCGKKAFDDEQQDTLLNPVLIIEVLSETTEAYDRGKKFEHYQYIYALGEYLLIAQDTCRMEQYFRQSGRDWRYSEFHALADIVKLETINCELALKDVYLKVSGIFVQD